MDRAVRHQVRRIAVRSVGGAVVLVALFFVLPLDDAGWWLGAVFGGALLAATVPITVARLLRVLESQKPVLDAIEALVFVLALLVVGFASIYLALDHDEGQFAGLETHVDALYFTMTTLSTVGFGDITATGQFARGVVTTQIVFNLAFVGAVVRVFAAAAKRDPLGR